MELVNPPRKPDKVVAEAIIEATHPERKGIGQTSMWVGYPYQDENGKWLCESHVEGFPQGKIPGSSSFEALTGAICQVRLHLEGLSALGYRLSIPELPDLIGRERFFERLFSLYGYVHSSSVKNKNIL